MKKTERAKAQFSGSNQTSSPGILQGWSWPKGLGFPGSSDPNDCLEIIDSTRGVIIT